MQNYWLHRATRIAFRVNLARWLESALPGFAAGCIGLGCAWMLARRVGFQWAGVFAVLGGLVFLGVAVYGVWRMRKSWFSRVDGLVFLEAGLRLHNRLSCAAAGVGDWPAPRATIMPSWRWRRVWPPFFFGAAFLCAAIWVPLSPETAVIAAKLESPLALSQVETVLDLLKKEETSTPEAVAALEAKMEELLTASQENWYSQSGLEAADALRQETRQAVAALDKQLNSAAEMLSSMEGSETLPNFSPTQANAWREALAGLQAGQLPANRSMQDAFKQCEDARACSPEQLKALQQRLSENAQACKEAASLLSSALNQFEKNLRPASLKGMQGCGGEPGDGDPDGNCPGDGGPGGGGPSAPLGLKNQPTDAQAQEMNPLASGDQDHAMLGDVLETTKGAPQEVSRDAGPSAGGAAGVGRGGEAVWNTMTTPKEAAVLQKYFQ